MQVSLQSPQKRSRYVDSCSKLSGNDWQNQQASSKIIAINYGVENGEAGTTGDWMKGTSKSTSLQAFPKTSKWRRRRDVLWQRAPKLGRSDRKSLAVDHWVAGTSDDKQRRQVVSVRISEEKGNINIDNDTTGSFTLYRSIWDMSVFFIFSQANVLLSTTRAQISAPTPKRGHPFSTVTRWLVFITDWIIKSSSIGRSDRRLITSASMPRCSNSLAASRHMPTARDSDTMVTCLPGQTYNKKWVSK